MSGSEWTSNVPIDCVSVQSCQCGADEACKYVQEIERLNKSLDDHLDSEAAETRRADRERDGARKAAAEIERLREELLTRNSKARHQAEEIEALRAYIAEIKKWQEEGERMIEPGAQWGPGGNVMAKPSTMFKLGAWWERRPWKASY